MNVVHVYDGHEKVYDGRGSVPNVIWNVARETARNHDVTVLERKWRGLDARAEHDGVVFERFDLRTGADEPWERVPYEAVESPMKLGRLVCDRTNFARVALSRVRELDPDIVHVHLPFAANVLVTVAPSLREKTVYTAHLGELRMNALADDQQGQAAPAADGGEVEGEDGGLGAPAVLDFVSPDTYLANRVAHTTVLNPDIADVFADRGVSRDRLSVVPNGVDVERFGDVDDARTRAIRDSYGIGDGPTLLFVGTVMPRKGVDDLIRAASQLIEAGYDDLRVIVAGEDDLDGEYTTDIRELARENGVAEAVSLPGFVPGEDLPALYAAADAFVLPSREEGFGMTVTEAMAAGTPVVATDVGGISRLVDEGKQGYVVRPNDPSGLVDGIDELLSASDSEAMADAARDRAAEYSWRGIATRFNDIYEEVARR
ncbi:glycosyltransferase family 4 protein [Halorientalis pallida]|uniref:Glycosyltransferase family 1 protein n=1 Tax=Halorientalis pallida TaxID=2479928 RepID=A0A498KSN1_9EURY|nr:glycosyltransferase family 4 protein [Halorientalis pallida]RXK46920.1 glycosyltransferase family 1 protein [Halorientalis pallida]